MLIGELAALAGVSTRTVRHYHPLGLLPEPVRLPNGYREYRLRDAVLLARVRRLTVAVSSQVNVVVELSEPITIVRPLGRCAEVAKVRFFADDPAVVRSALLPSKSRDPLG